MQSLLSLIGVGVLWGATNPFLKRTSKGIENVKADNAFSQFIQEIVFLFSNWKYMVTFLLNQSGSVLYYFSLQSTDLTVAVPVSNSSTFVWTALVGWWLGEDKPKWSTIMGALFVTIGVVCYILDKS